MIKKNQVFYAFNKKTPPVHCMNSGETITIETLDAFGGQITSEDDRLDKLDWSKVNPATGPIYINDAMPGDFLKVDINTIDLDTTGVMASVPEAGLFGELHQSSKIKVFKIKNNQTHFNELSLPLEPMIGVIGVAPLEPVPNGEPGPHGGNMDNRIICAGSTLYLPVFVEGALFGLGDLHAAMGDGEVNVTGIEIGGRVTVTLSVVKQMSHGHPILTDESHFYTIYSADTLDNSAKGVAHEMLHWVKKALDYSDSDAAMLMSLVGHLEICQVVDPKLTTRMKMPISYFQTLKL